MINLNQHKGGLITLMLLFNAALLFAQPDRLWQEQHYAIEDQAFDHSLWGNLEYGLMSNTVSNALFQQSIFTGQVDPKTSSALRSFPSDSRSLIGGGLSGSLWYKKERRDGPSWMLGFQAQEQAFGNLPTGLLQLYFEGNAPFAGERLDLSNAHLQYWSYQSLGFGLEWQRGDWQYGATLSLLKIGRYQSLKTGTNAHLFTEEYGAYIEANLDVDWVTTAAAQDKVSAWYGTGVQSNLYVSYAPEAGASSLSVQLIDMGFMHFGGLQRSTINQDTLYEGIRINDILDVQTNLETGADLDSLEGLIGLTSENTDMAFFLPGRIQIDYTHDFSEQFSVAFQMRQYFFISPPMFRAGLAWRPLALIAIEPYFMVGGFSRVDYGLTAVLNIKQRFQCLVRYGLLEQQIASENSSGQSLSIGAALHF